MRISDWSSDVCCSDLNNVISDKIKVNDLRGNPIEMAAQVVWRVTDTAQALFDVDDYKEFVMAQIEAAVRSIGSRYPYDDIEHQEVTLRSEEHTSELQSLMRISYAVFCLKKKKKHNRHTTTYKNINHTK